MLRAPAGTTEQASVTSTQGPWFVQQPLTRAFRAFVSRRHLSFFVSMSSRFLEAASPSAPPVPPEVAGRVPVTPVSPRHGFARSVKSLVWARRAVSRSTGQVPDREDVDCAGTTPDALTSGKKESLTPVTSWLHFGGANALDSRTTWADRS